MPRLHDLDLLAGGFASGAIFLAKAPFRITFERKADDTVVEARAGMRWLAVRMRRPPARELVLGEALSAAHLALDLLARRGHFAQLDSPMLDHVLWYSASDGVHARFGSISVYDAPRINLVARVLRADGTVDTGPQAPPWHPLLRFYRLSNIAEDPIERFRYLYLGIENAVSGLSAKLPSEGEPAWLRRVLVSESIDCAAVLQGAAPGAATPQDGVVDLVYRQARTSAFHAKQGRQVMLPSDPEALQAASIAGQVALRLLKALAAKAGQQLGGSGWFQGGFELLTEPVAREARIAVSADPRPHDPDEEVFADEAHPVTELVPSVTTQKFVRLMHAHVVEPTIQIGRAGLVMGAMPVCALCLETVLDTSGFKSFEFVVGIHMRQDGVPLPVMPTL